MGKMNTQNDKKKKKKEYEDREDILVDENGIPVGIPLEKVKELTPRLYEELIIKKSSLRIDQVSEDYYEDDEFHEENDFANEDDNIDEFDVNNSDLEIKIKTKTKYDSDYLEGFEPSAVDFIRRAKTIKEANEVIDYLEKKKELNTIQAAELRSKLEKDGLESFGAHKKDGYYFQLAENNRLKDKMRLIRRKELESIDNGDENSS